MAQHTRPEILRHIHAILTADMPTCHRCSWAWSFDQGAFTLKRPSAACEISEHRSLLEGPAKAAGILTGWLQAS
jgi:hypothetical protein